jgi:hypothetical protein
MAWKSGHESECTTFALQPDFIPVQRILLRILIQHNNGTLMSPSLFQAILALKSDQARWSESGDYLNYLKIAEIAMHASGTSLELNTVWDILCKVLFWSNNQKKHVCDTNTILGAH